MPTSSYYERNKEKYRQYYLNNREYKIKQSNDAKRKRMFGLTSEQFEELKLKQNFACAICSNELEPGRRTHIDHCHATGKVRGLLCENCNRGLGMFKDNKSYLENAIRYLQNANQ